MKKNYTYSKLSDINISFYINEKSQNFEESKLQNSQNNIALKGKFPENKIFRINSLFLNKERNITEISTQYDCIFNEKNNSLCLIFNNQDNYENFTKEKLLNILEFAISIEIDTIYLLVNKSNKHYLNIIQDMLIVGFEIEKNFTNINIDGSIYKSLKMPIKNICKEIKEINLI